jgi:hypothetical protein
VIAALTADEMTADPAEMTNEGSAELTTDPIAELKLDPMTEPHVVHPSSKVLSVVVLLFVPFAALFLALFAPLSLPSSAASVAALFVVALSLVRPQEVP